MGNTNKAVQDLKTAIDHFERDERDGGGEGWSAQEERLLKTDVRSLNKVLAALKKEDGKVLSKAIQIDTFVRDVIPSYAYEVIGDLIDDWMDGME